MKVRVNSLYEYDPNMRDLAMPCAGNSLVHGQVVRVINLPMAPKANTMGQCYVASPETGKFICMVSTSSLVQMTPEARKLYNYLIAKRKSQNAGPAEIKIEYNAVFDSTEAQVIE
jgi:hypothetical protein